MRVKIRDEGLVKNKAVYVALALNPDGEKDVLGLWIEQTEGAKFWLKVVNELKARGVNDILIAVVDGLKGFPEAITSVFPQTIVQTCIVHLIRNSLAFVSWKDRKAILPAIKAIYRKRCRDHTSGRQRLVAIAIGDQAARRTLVLSGQAHGRSSSSFWAGQPLTSLARMSAR